MVYHNFPIIIKATLWLIDIAVQHGPVVDYFYWFIVIVLHINNIQ